MRSNDFDIVAANTCYGGTGADLGGGCRGCGSTWAELKSP